MICRTSRAVLFQSTLSLLSIFLIYSIFLDRLWDAPIVATHLLKPDLIIKLLCSVKGKLGPQLLQNRIEGVLPKNNTADICMYLARKTLFSYFRCQERPHVTIVDFIFSTTLSSCDIGKRYNLLARIIAYRMSRLLSPCARNSRHCSAKKNLGPAFLCLHVCLNVSSKVSDSGVA